MVRKRKTGKKAVQSKKSRQFCAARLNPVTSFIRTALPAGLLFGLYAGNVAANPEGGVVVAGNGNFVVEGKTYNINQLSPSLIAHFSKFNIQFDETVNINQKASDQFMARIFDQNPSEIFGQLNAQGSVLLLNSNGLIFGPDASVNVGSLIASGLDISDEDFMNGKHVFFNKDGSEGGKVVNRGLIQAATGGSVTLLGGAVKNEGTIIATAGQVNLIAGKKVTMDFDGDGLMQFTVDEKILENVHDLEDAVSNTGTISADGGTVLLKGSAAKDVFTNVVNNSGVIGASRIENKGGVIKLVASGTSNSLINTGTLNASSSDSDGGTIEIYASDTAIVSEQSLITAASSSDKGGKITITGDKVGLFDAATIDASGVNGGGTVLVGGDYQGKNPDIQNASFTTITSDASIKADAITNGDAGKVIVWSDNTTRFYGDISAEGGSESGDGGFVEVSGKGHLVFKGTVSTDAVNGKTGTLLLDPTDITIQAAGPTDLENDGVTPTTTFAETTPTNSSILTTADLLTALGSNNVVVSTASAAAGTGNITVADDIAYTGGTNRTLSLQAENTITIDTNANITSSTATLDVTLAADTDNSGAGAIVMNAGSSIESNGGNILLGGGDTAASGNARGEASNIEGVSLTDATLNAAGGNITIRGQGFTDAGGSNIGVEITRSTTGSIVSTTGTGTITINGTAGTSAGGSNDGVLIDGLGTQLVSVDGLIDIDGQGNGTGSSNTGVAIRSDASVHATGLGDIDIDGTNSSTSDNFQRGVLIDSGGDVLSSGSGAINIDGTAANTTGTNNEGIRIEGSGSSVASTGSGNITIVGNGRGSGNAGVGVVLETAAFVSSTSTGNVSITGTGSTDGGTGNDGIAISAGSDISSTSSGDVTLLGTGGAGANSEGIAISSASAVIIGSASSTGNVSITGNATVGTTGITGNGNTIIQTTGAGTVGISSEDSIIFNTNATNISTAGGAVSINADSEADGAGDITLAAASTITSNGGNVNFTANDLDLTASGSINAGAGTVTIIATNGQSLGLGDGATATAADLTINGAELTNITATQLTLGDTTTGIIVVDDVSAVESNNVGTVSLVATADDASISFSNAAGGATFNALSATADNGIAVNGNLTTDTGNLTLEGDADNAIDVNDNVTFASGITVASAGTMTLDATTGKLSSAAGTLTLNAADGITINDNLTTAAALTIDADTDTGDGVGTLTVVAGATVSTTGTTLQITAEDIAINTTSGALNSGAATTTIIDSDNNGIGLGDTASTDGLDITGAELQRITSTGLTLRTAGAITVDNITAANSNNISGTTTLDAATVGAVGSIAFSNTASIFNALTANADAGIAINVGLTTDTGNLVLEGDADNATSGAVTFGSGITVQSAGSMTLDATTGKLSSAAGTLALNAADGITINDNLTTASTLTINADTDAADNDGTLTIAAGATVSTTSSNIEITANDIAINTTSGAITSSGTMTITDSDNSGIGLGDTAIANGLNITGAELQRITASGTDSLTLTTGGNITVDNISAANSNNIANTLILDAASVGAAGTVTFQNNSSTFNQLRADADAGITVNADVTTDNGFLFFRGDVDGATSGGITFNAGRILTSASNIDLRATTDDMTAAGALTLNAADGVSLTDNLTTNGLTTINTDTDAGDDVGTLSLTSNAVINTSSNTLSITTNEITYSGTAGLNSGAAATTIIDSDNTGMALGTGFVTNGVNINTTELQNITATGLTLRTGGNIRVDGVGAGQSDNVAGVLTLDTSTVGTASTVTFNGNSTFNALSVTADDGVVINGNLTTDTGALTLEGDADNLADTNDNIALAAGVQLQSQTTLQLDATTGDIAAAGAATLRAVDGITLNDDYASTATGALTINADTNNDGTGTLSAVNIDNSAGADDAISITADDVTFTTLNGTDSTVTIIASNGQTIGLGDGAAATAADLTIDGTELTGITATQLTLGDTTTGNIAVSEVTAVESQNVGTVSLVATANNASIAFSDAASTFNALTASADDGIAVNVNVTTDTGALTLEGDADNLADTNDNIALAAGVQLQSQTTLQLDATTGDIAAAGAATLRAVDGITLNDDYASTATGALTINADTNNDGTGTLSAVNIDNSAGADDAISITADDVTFTTLNGTDSTVTIIASNGQTIGLGDGAAATAADLTIDGTELTGITATQLTLGDTTTGNIAVSEVTAVESQNVGTVSLVATANNASIAFSDAASTFNALTASADDGIAVNVNVTTDTGALTLEGDADNLADTNDNIALAAGVQLQSQTTLQLDATTGDIAAAGAATLRAVDGITLNDDYASTATGALTINADTNNDGTGTLSAVNIDNSAGADDAISITADDVTFTTLNGTDSTVTIIASNGQTIGLGDGAAATAADLTIDGTELTGITATQLTLGDTTTGNIAVSEVTAVESQNVGTVSLVATANNASIAFSDAASTFNALTASADDGIAVNVNVTTDTGALTLEGDADNLADTNDNIALAAGVQLQSQTTLQLDATTGDIAAAGAATLRAVDGITLNDDYASTATGALTINADTNNDGTGTLSAVNIDNSAGADDAISITADDVTFTTLNGTDSTVTIIASNGQTIGLGDGAAATAADLTIDGTELTGITATQLTLGDTTTGNIAVSEVTAVESQNVGTVSLVATANNASIAFSDAASTFNALTASADDGIAVNVNVTTDTGALTLEGDADNLADTNDNIALAAGVQLQSQTTLQLDATTGDIAAAGAATLRAVDGITLNDDYASTATGALTINADTNNDGTGTLSAVNIDNSAGADDAISITADDVTFTTLNGTDSTVTIIASNGQTIGLGDGAAATAADLTIDGTELTGITATQLTLGDTTTGNIAVSEVTAVESQNVGTVSLVATANNASIAFSDAASTFNALTASADDGIAVNVNVTTDTGALTLEGDADNLADTNDNIALAAGVQLQSQTTLQLDATTGDIAAAGAATLRAVDGITLNDDYASTATGALTINADTNNDGTGTLSAVNIDNSAGADDAISITADDVTFTTLNGTDSTVTIIASNGQTIGLGDGAAATAADLTIDGTELTGITATQLTLGDTTTGNIAVSEVTAVESQNVGTVSLVATANNASIAFSDAASTFNALTASADDGIAVNVNVTTDTGALTLEGDADNLADTNDNLTFAAGVTLSSASTLRLEATTQTNASVGAGALTLTSTTDTTIRDALSAGTLTINAVNVTAENVGTGNHDITATAGNLTVNASGTLTLEDTVGGRTRLVTTNAGSDINLNVNDLVIQNNDAAAQIVSADAIGLNPGAVTIGLGDQAAASTFNLTDAELNALSGNVTIGSGTALAVSLDMATAYTGGGGNLTLVTGSTINDNDGASGFGFRSTAGTLTLTSGDAIGGTGANGLQTDISALSVLSTGGNNVTVTDSGAGGNTTYNIATGGAGAIDVTQTTNNLQLDTNTTTGTASFTATAGAITDVTAGEGAGNENITATVVTLTAGTGIGSAGAATDIDTAATELDLTSTTGGIFIAETDAVQLGNGTGGINTVTSGDIDIDAGGAITTGNTITTAGNGNIAIDTTADGITLSNAVTANGSGNVTLNAAALLTVNAAVSSTTGALNLTGGTGVTHDANGDLTTGGTGTIDVTATANDITMVDGTVYTADTGAVTLSAATNIATGRVTSNGTQTATATAGAITDVTAGEGAGNENFAGTVVTLTAGTGIGSAGAATDIDTAATELDLTSTTGGIFIAETDAVQLGNGTGGINTVTSGDIDIDAGGAITTGNTITTAGNGNIAIDTTADGITLSNAVTANGSGNVTLNAAALLTVNAAVSSTTGALNLTGGTGVTHDANGDLTTGGTGTIDVTATANDITMVDGTVYTADTGAVTLSAATNIATGRVTSNGTQTATATAGAITDVTAGEGAGNENFAGTVVTLTAGTGIGSAGAATDIDTAATELDLTSTTGGIFIAETDAVQLGNGTGGINTVTSGDIDIDAGGAITTGNTITTAGNGNIAIDTTADGITLSNAVTANGSGNVTLNAAALLTVNAAVSSTTGALNLTGGTGVTHDANGDLTTGGTGTIDVTATANDITMVDGTVYTADTGAVTLSAATNIATGRVTSNGTQTATATAGAITDVTAGEGAGNENFAGTVVTLTAGTGIGSAGAATDIDTAATELDLTSTTGGIFIAETDAVQLGNGTGGINTVTSGDIDIDAGGAITTGNTITTAGNGNIAIDTTADGITLSNAVTANGSGNVTLNAAALLTVNAAVSSTTGALNLTGGTGVTHDANGDLTTGGTGTIDVTATANDITMVDGTVYTADTGAVTLSAATNIATGRVTSNGTQTATATAGAITDVTAGEGAGNENFAGTVVTLTAGTGIGSAGAATDIDTAATELDLTSTTGGIFIAETDAVQLGNGTGGINTVTSGDIDIDAGGAITTGNTITTAGNGNIAIDTTADGITLSNAVTANGSGNVTLNAAALLTVNAAVSSTTGALNLTGGTGVTHDANGDLTTGGTGTIDVTATANDITMVDGTVYTADTGAVTLSAATNIATGRVTSNGTQTATATAGAITDVTAGEGAGNENFAGTVVTLTAGTGIGSAGAATDIDTAATTSIALTSGGANAAGDIFVTDSGALNTNQVTFTTNAANAQTVTLEAASWTTGGALGNTQDNLSLTATTGGFTDGGATLTADTLSLTTTNQNIGAVAPNKIDTNATTLNASAGNGNIFINETNALALGTINTTGNIDIMTNGALTDTGVITVGGTAAFDTNNNDVTLNTATNDFTGDVSFANVNNVAITDTNAIQFGASTIGGTFQVNANGTIVDNGDLTVTGGTTTLTAGAGNDIILNNNNDFSTVSIISGNNVTLVDTNAIDLGASTVSGNLGVTSTGTITDSGALSVSGTTTLAANGPNNITLDNANDFATVSVLTGNDISLNDTNAIVLGDFDIAGSLTVTAGGAITQTAAGAAGDNLNIGTTSSLTATGNAITLNAATNDFGGAVSVTGTNISLRDTNTIDLGASTVSGTLDVTASGVITDSGTVSVGGTTTLAAGAANDITLDEAASDYNTVVITSGNNVTITDTDNIDLGASTVSGTLTVTTAAGDITDSGNLTVTNAATFNANGAGSNITLDSAGNSFNGTVDFNSVGGLNNVTIVDTTALDLQASTIGGALNVTAAGITDSGTVSVGGTTTLAAGAANDITLADAASDYNTVVITSGNNVAITDIDNIDLGASTVSGTLTVTTAAGDITDSGNLTVANAATFNANGAGSNIILNSAGNTFNGTVDFNSVGGLNNVTIVDTNSLDLAAATIGGNLNITAAGITDSGTLIVAGTTTLAVGAGNDITLDDAANDFGTVTVTSANNAAITDSNTMILTTSTAAGTLSLTTTGVSITDSIITANNLSFNAGGALTLAGNNIFLTAPGGITFPTTVNMGVDDSLAITVPDGNDLTIGAGGQDITSLLAASANGHLIFGATVANGTDPFYNDVIDIDTATLTIGSDLIRNGNGSMTFLAGDVVLGGDITVPNGTIGIGANGELGGTTGTITTGGAIITLDSQGTTAGADVANILLVADTSIDALDIVLTTGGNEVDIAAGLGGRLEFNELSNSQDVDTDPLFDASLNGGFLTDAGFAAGVTFSFSLNPASNLVGLETLAFIDVGLFEEELTLFGQIGAGLALSLAQCEESEGCAPSISEDEIYYLIQSLEARLLELERRLAEESDPDVRADLEELIESFNNELKEFNNYRQELEDFFAEDEDDYEEDADEELDDDNFFDENVSTDEVERLAKVLETVKARIEWLTGIKANPEERARLGNAIGIELTQEALDAIIDAAKAEAVFIENQIKLLLEGTEARLYEHSDSQKFTAEARDYNSMQTLHYGSHLLSLDDSKVNLLANYY